jgi:hypothetical protein
MGEARFRIVLSGELVPGLTREAAVAALAGLFDAPPHELARSLDTGDRPVDGLFGSHEASALQRRLEQIGVRARVESVPGGGPPARSSVGGLRLTRTHGSAEAGQVRCAGCGHLQLAADHCASCGLPMSGRGHHRPAAGHNPPLVDARRPAKTSAAPRNLPGARAAPRDIHATTRRDLRRDWLEEDPGLPTERHHLNLFMGTDSAGLADACVRMAQGTRTRPTLSWVPGAVFSPFLWAMYRKLYAWGILIFLFEILLPVGLIIFGSKQGVPGSVLYLGLGLAVASRVLWPAVLKYLYCRHARQTIGQMHRMSPTFAPDIDIATRGGTSRTSVLTGIVVSLVVSLLAWSIVDTLYGNLVEPTLTFSPSADFGMTEEGLPGRAGAGTEFGPDDQVFSEDQWIATEARLRALSQRIDAWLDGSGRAVNPARLTIADIASELALKPESILDGWGGVINFRSDGRIYKLSSAGPDGEYGNADDIEYRRKRKH